MRHCTPTWITQTNHPLSCLLSKDLKHINLPRGTKHKALHSLPRWGYKYFTALAQPLGERAGLADCALIEKERATLIVQGCFFEVGPLHFKSLSSTYLSPSASKDVATSQREHKYSDKALHCGISKMKQLNSQHFYS